MYLLPGNRVMVSFSMFNLQESEFCNADYLEIRVNNGGGELLGHYCGSNTLPSNITAANKLWVKFRSDGEGTAPGFIADYSLRKKIIPHSLSSCIYLKNQFLFFSSWKWFKWNLRWNCLAFVSSSVHPKRRFQLASYRRSRTLRSALFLQPVLHRARFGLCHLHFFSSGQSLEFYIWKSSKFGHYRDQSKNLRNVV